MAIEADLTARLEALEKRIAHLEATAEIGNTFKTGIVINEDSNDADTRIESDGNENMLYVDAGNNRVGIGTATPAYRLHVYTPTTGATYLGIDSVDSLAVLQFNENSAARYGLYYDPANNYLAIYGSGVGADIMRIPDGQLTIDGNSTFDYNAFDYVCDACGWHGEPSDKCPRCGSPVAWHDDAALLAQATRGGLVRDLPRETLARLERLGIVNTYGTLDKPPEQRQVYLSITRALWFIMSAVAQLYRKQATT